MNPSTPPTRNKYQLHWVIRFVFFHLARLFYPQIEVQGREHLPVGGPVIFVLNHPNGLLDPLLLMVALDRPVSFLAKSTLFGNPVGRTFMEAFGALPIYRRRDEGLAGGPNGDSVQRNEITFARCRTLLGQGEALALFPEGTTHSGAQLLPLRTGAARIGLSAEYESGWTMGVQIVPVGLWYQRKTDFRTSVLLRVGRPFDLTGYAAGYATDEYQTVQVVTHRLKTSLDEVVLQAENAELLAAVPVVAAWTVPPGQAPALAQQHRWATTLLSAYKVLHRTDPVRLESIAQQARHYADTLYMLGISNPWALERPVVNRWQLSWLMLRLVLCFPLALAGFILSYGPYRLAGPIATYAVGPHDVLTSTVKLIVGSLLVLLGWILEAIVWGALFGGLWGALLFVVAPPLAYVALRWGEHWRELRELVSCRQLRLQRGELVQSLVAQRNALARQVMDAVQSVQS